MNTYAWMRMCAHGMPFDAEMVLFEENAKINCHPREHSFEYTFFIHFHLLRAHKTHWPHFKACLLTLPLPFSVLLCSRKPKFEIHSLCVDADLQSRRNSSVDCFKMNETSNRKFIIAQTNSFVRTFRINIIRGCGGRRHHSLCTHHARDLQTSNKTQTKTVYK